MIPTAALLVILAGATLTMGQTKDHRFENLGLLSLLSRKPLSPFGQGPYNIWDRSPRIQEDLGIYPRFNPARDDDGETNYNDEILRDSKEHSAVETALDSRHRRQPAPTLDDTLTMGQTKDHRFENLGLLSLLARKPLSPFGQGPYNIWDRSPRIQEDLGIYPRFNPARDDDGETNYNDEILRGSKKRSAVATVLNGRRRRQPAPALGKAVTPYVGVGLLDDMGSFFDSLRDNLETLASLSPQQRSNLFVEPPTVMHASSSGGGSGGSGIRKIHALRPIHPTGKIRSYNRRSDLQTYGYPRANHHDPGLLWTGLGR